MVEGQKQEYVGKCQEAFGQAMSVVQTTGKEWNPVDCTENISAHTMKNEGQLDSLKIEFYVNQKPEDVAKFLFNNWNDLCKNFAPKAINNERLATDFGENAYLYRETFDLKNPVVDIREAVVFHMLLATPEQHVLIATSVDNGTQAPEGHIRADIKYLVHLCEPTVDDANRTHVIACQTSDPCGSIPELIKNKILKKRVKLYESLVPKLNSLSLNS